MAAQRKVLFFSIHAMLFLWWCSCGGVFVVVFLWSCLFCGVCVVVFLWWCFCSGVLVVVFVWWCFCVGVVVFLCWCFCAGVFVVVFLCWCFCGGVCVGVFVWLCSCGGVFVVVFSSWCGSVFVLVWWCSCGGVFVVVFLWWCTKSYSVLQRTTPVLRQYYKSFQNEHFVRGFRNFSQKKLPKSSFRARLPPNFTEQASKTSVSRDVSNNFHRKSFQNHRFVRGFFQISQNKLPKRAFRAMLPTIFTEKASKMIVSCEASSKFHRTKLPKRAFRAMLPPIFNKNLRFATVSRDRHTESYERVPPAKSKCASRYSGVPSKISKCAFRHSAVRKNVWIHRPWTDPLRAHKNVTFYYSFGRSTPRFYREGWPIENEICVSLQFWAIDTTFLPRGLTASKWNLRFATVLGDRHHVFTERVDREQMKFAFRYSFGRSTPRFYREGWPRANEICVSLQFWAIDTTFLARGLLSGGPSPSRPVE